MSHRALAVAVLGLLAAGAPPASAAFPGRNGQIAWHREHTGAPPDLWVANADGSAARKVLSRRDAVEAEPAWSPTAPATLAFVRAGARPPEIFVGDLTTGSVRRVTGHRRDSLSPSFSPDGRRIAYHSGSLPTSEDEPPPQYDIYVVNVDGTGVRRLTRDRLYSTEPEFSPDGRRILFAEARFTRTGRLLERLAIMDADGDNRHALTAFGAADEVNAHWMPDGTRIVFELKNRPGAGSDIATMDADGSNRRLLLGGPGFETQPVPSPDGTRIVFVSDRDRRGGGSRGRRTEIYTMAADGTGVTRLTNNNSPDVEPDWQRLP
jgi:TolB protein